ncbi:hypothetical protein DTL70_10070 [Streptomyces diacarni]|uniref:Uncharacterized protein n=2 Tax=Streptomyces diacarni TaxID=2800381 RepID=A0A367F438_9ACTN|nr:hypothetical protein DTL70_10070 [Streptomyces diacarni]
MDHDKVAAVNYCSHLISGPAGDDDPGGVNAGAYLYPCGESVNNWHFRALFYAYGEQLTLEDRYTDEHEVSSSVKVYTTEGKLLDEDYFHTGTKQTYNLGTPDGSGDIAEGLRVKFNVCVRGVECSTGGSWNGYIYGTA